MASGTFYNDYCFHNSLNSALHGLRQLRQTLLERTADNILSCGSSLSCGQAYNGCFCILHRKQSELVSWVLVVSEVADLESVLLEK